MFLMFSKPLKKWLYFVFGKKIFLVKIKISTILAKRIDQGNENEEKKNPNINKLINMHIKCFLVCFSVPHGILCNSRVTRHKRLGN